MPPKQPKPPGVEDVTAQLSGLTLKDDFILEGAHPRPGLGTLGAPVTVEANMFPVRRTAHPLIHHYDVTISPVVKTQRDKMPKPLAHKIWGQVVRDNQKAPDAAAFNASAYDDQKSVFTPVEFQLNDKGKKEIQVVLPEEGREVNDSMRFKVVMQHVNTTDLDTIYAFCKGDRQAKEVVNTVLTAIMQINVLIRQDPMDRYVPKGARGKFFGLDGAVPISDGAIVGKGFYQSFRPTSNGMPAIQLDTAHSAFFRAGPLQDLIPQVLGLGGGGRGGRGGRGAPRGGRGGPPGGGGGHVVIPQALTMPQIQKLNKLFYGLKFTLPYKKTPRIFTLKMISRKPASEVSFRLDGKDGAADQQIGLLQYFKQQFNITIQRPGLPCVVYGKNFQVPLELAHVCDFNAVPFTGMTGDQAADMIRVAAQRPNERADSIKGWRNTLDYNKQPKIKTWGLEVHPKMLSVKARVLPTPKVTYNNKKTLNCAFGGWNLKGVSFTRPGAPLKSWAVVSFDRYFGAGDWQKFLSYLGPVLTNYGIRIENKAPPFVQFDRAQIQAGISEACKQAYLATKADPQLIFVIMGGKDTFVYQSIKNVAAMKLKAFVPTQCLQAQKLKSDRGLDQYCGNIAMKIQAKLGGVTHEVPIPQVFDRETMMIGADVTHPPPAGARALLHPSIAVTVSATSGDNVKFEPGIRLQEGRTEIIQDLKAMMIEHIKVFERNSKVKPSKIIFFRDGVSEGQYMQVTDREVEAIREAAATFGPGYKPKITFVVCAKRHNMRFFAVNPNDADRTGNLKPGTVVDQTVTHPYAFDFYLQAHAGLQGTARPTHYIVLVDENGFTADKMQNLCNTLCYTYARATRAVSLIPVAYYADIIANQCRFMVYTDDDASETATTASGDTPTLQHRSFDPKMIDKRMSAAAKKVAWYM